MKLLYLMAMSIALIDSCGRSPEVISNATLAAPTPQKEKKVVMEKEVLANLLEKTNKLIAYSLLILLQNSMATVQSLERAQNIKSANSHQRVG